MSAQDLNQLAARASLLPGSVSWEEVHAAIAQEARRRGEWAGMPVPQKGMSMTIHPSYPFANSLARTFMPEPSLRVCKSADVEADTEIRNSWNSYRDGKRLSIFRDGKRYSWAYTGNITSALLLINTIGAARSWDFDAELRAMETLKRHVHEWAYQCYVMTGSFLETSPRSNVTYMFRRLRPTVALTANRDRKGRDVGMRILCCLCAHPVGYFNDSWAGALCPTDDVLAHLLMMRGCEAKFWAHANQHHPLAPEAGL